MNHSPIPWHDAAPNSMDGPATTSTSHIIYADSVEIARVYGDKGLPVKENACLIESAPIMREALEKLAIMGEQGMKPSCQGLAWADYAEWFTFHDKVAQIARAAIPTL